MHQSLVKSLMLRNVIKEKTQFEVSYIKRSLNGNFVNVTDNVSLNEIKKEYFSCYSVKSGVNINVNSDQILKIDGMSADRLAVLFNLNMDGTEKPKGKKRGRKPKIR